MVTLKIDDKEVSVEPGTTILHAAEQIGIEIPTFCYHPGLSIAANCRMCLVDTNKSPKPLPACHAQVMDGMEVSTQNEHIKRTRKAVLEFILLNHPIDCPVCDKAGECALQDHYFRYSARPSRSFHRKQHKAKAKILGPDIILDAERCIMCSRCVRFCDEIAGESQLEFTKRGEQTELSTFPGMQLDNPYAGNVVDICPVGALTSRDFRFKTRVWFLQSEQSVCTGCSRLCTIRVDTYENAIRRLKPMHNPKVNDWWMCDEGRLSYHEYQENRAQGPRATVDSESRVVALQKALDDAGELLTTVPAKKIAVVLTPWFTNEDAFLVSKLFEDGGSLADATFYMGGRTEEGVEDTILRKADKNPNRKGVEAILKAHNIAFKPLNDLKANAFDLALVFGDNHQAGPWEAELQKIQKRIQVSSFDTELSRTATVFLPARITWEKDGTMANFEGVVQRIRRAVQAAPTVKSEGWYAMKLAQALGLSLSFNTPREIFSAIAEEIPEFFGMDLDSLGAHGLRFGEPAEQHQPASMPKPEGN